jgi:hypothetical protein
LNQPAPQHKGALMAVLVPPGVLVRRCPVTVVSLPARGRPPEAAARRPGLGGVEKSPSSLNRTDATERNSSACFASRPAASVELLLLQAAGGRCRGRRRPTQATRAGHGQRAGPETGQWRRYMKARKISGRSSEPVSLCRDEGRAANRSSRLRSLLHPRASRNWS